MSLTIAVLHLKGGSGKTTLAVNLAAAAHLEGRKTLLVDADSQGSAYDWSVARADGSALEGLAVVRADKPMKASRWGEITRGWDVVVIDGPARQRDVTESAALAADVVVVPICPGPYDFWCRSDTSETLDRADQVRDELGRPRARRALVLNRASSATRLARVAEEELRAGGEFVAGVVRYLVAFGERGSRGESVFGAAAAQEAADDMLRVWRAVVKESKSHGIKERRAHATPQVAATVDLAEARARRNSRGAHG